MFEAIGITTIIILAIIGFVTILTLIIKAITD